MDVIFSLKMEREIMDTHKEKNNFQEIISNYWQILCRLNLAKIACIDRETAVKKESLFLEKGKFNTDPRYLEFEIDNLQSKREALIQTKNSLNQKNKFLKDQAKLFHYLVNYCYEWIFFDKDKLEFRALTKETYLNYKDDTGAFLKEYLFDFGKFEITLRLSDSWIDEDSAHRNIVIRNSPKSDFWLETENDLRLCASYVHPHISQTGSPCLGGFRCYIAKCHNLSKYLDILLILQKSFIPSFNSSSAYSCTIGGQGRSEWHKIFTNARFFVKEEKK